MRYLALDWGSVRIGAAVSDPDGKIAFPLAQVLDTKTATTEIKKITQEMEVEKILVGLPKSLSGQDTKSTEEVRKFIQQLQEAVASKIELFDERFSSVAAGKQLDEQGVSSKNQRQIKDNIAAQMILQQYLDSKN